MSSLLNGGRPCELHWEKPWASSHPQAQPRTMRTEGRSVDRGSRSCINQVTGWVQLTSRPPLSGLMLDQQLLHMSTMEWDRSQGYCGNVLFTWSPLQDSSLYPEESQQDHIYIFNSYQIKALFKQHVFREAYWSEILPLRVQSYQTPPLT